MHFVSSHRVICFVTTDILWIFATTMSSKWKQCVSRQNCIRFMKRYQEMIIIAMQTRQCVLKWPLLSALIRFWNLNSIHIAQNLFDRCLSLYGVPFHSDFVQLLMVTGWRQNKKFGQMVGCFDHVKMMKSFTYISFSFVSFRSAPYTLLLYLVMTIMMNNCDKCQLDFLCLMFSFWLALFVLTVRPFVRKSNRPSRRSHLYALKQ